MHAPEDKFNQIAARLCEVEGVSLGNMMRSPGIKYKDKVFAFFHEDNMTFKLGPDYDLAKHHIDTFEYLSPFKKKPPMKAWYVIAQDFQDQWESLTWEALHAIKS